MKELTKEVRMYLAEKLLLWALNLSPEGEQKSILAQLLIKYCNDIQRLNK